MLKSLENANSIQMLFGYYLTTYDVHIHRNCFGSYFALKRKNKYFLLFSQNLVLDFCLFVSNIVFL